MSHCEIILKHLREHKYISSMQAFSEYGITRLASRIHDLRKDGYNIGSVWRTRVNRYGNEVAYLDYFLIKESVFKRLFKGGDK